MERKAAKGAWTHVPRPYGYLVDPTTKRLIPHPDERHIVADMFTRDATTRVGTRAIAAHLNNHGHRTRRGGLWSSHSVGRIIGNRLYLGELAFLDQLTIGAHDPLTNPATFAECERIMNERGEAHSRRAASNFDTTSPD
jgi:site-specific DNA recombinase